MTINILTAAFNNLKKYSDNTFVIQCNGSILQNNDLLRAFAEDIAALQNAGVNIIIIHDGNNIVSSMIDKFTLKGASDNLIITDQATAEIVEMILSGHVNQKIVSQLNQAGAYVTGISGKDAQFMIARRAKIARYDYSVNEKILNFGFLGELALINPDILFLLEDNGLIPVISTIALGEDGKTYRIDASEISGAIASILSVQKIFFLSDIPGITDYEGKIIDELDSVKASGFITDSTENNELSSNIRAALMTLENNTEMAHIIDGKIPHCLMRELFTDELVGTKIKL